MKLADIIAPATPATSATRWPAVAKVAGVAAGHPENSGPRRTVPSDYERRVRAWLAEIGETDPECIEQTVANALADPAGLSNYVEPPGAS